MHPFESSVTPGLKVSPKPVATGMKSPTVNTHAFSHATGKSTKFSLTIPSVRQVPSGSLLPKKVQGQFLSPSPLKKMKPNPLKRVKQEHFKIEYNPEEPATSLKSDSYLPEQMWPPRGEASPLHLSRFLIPCCRDTSRKCVYYALENKWKFYIYVCGIKGSVSHVNGKTSWWAARRF